MKYKIYHPEGGVLNHKCLHGDMDFDLVATVEANSFETAFIKSQNDFNPHYAHLGIRSTSVGDIIVNEEGVSQLVLGLGFRQIPTKAV